MHDSAAATPEVQFAVATGTTPMYLFELQDWLEPFPRHWHEEWGIAVINQGVNRFWFRGAWHQAGDGAVIIVPPGEIHDGGLATGVPWGERMAYFPLESMLDLVEGFTGVRQEPRFAGPIVLDAELARSFLNLHSILRNTNPVDTLQASEAQISCIGLLTERYGSTCTVSTECFQERLTIRRVIELLNEDPATKHSVKDLAVEAGLSVFHFIRTFQKEIGMPPHAYLKQLRIKRARELLLTGVPIVQSAHASGFSDQAHLTREFRRTMGVTPGQYLHAHDITPRID